MKTEFTLPPDAQARQGMFDEMTKEPKAAADSDVSTKETTTLEVSATSGPRDAGPRDTGLRDTVKANSASDAPGNA